MQAEEIQAGKLFGSDQQLIVPLWQRGYSWDRPQWAELWADIGRVHEQELAGHFMGSVVLQALPWSGLPSNARQFLVVDGQQRVATLTLLVCAIRDRLAQLTQTDEDRERVRREYTSQLLLNTNLTKDHHHRLVLQENDRVLLDPIVCGTGGGAGLSLVDRAYSFFRQELSKWGQPEVVKLLSAVLVKLSAVWITLEEGDNAHRVFQTLNAGGKKLKQADLVRNYFFLVLGPLSDEFYEKHWRQLESDLTERELEDFLVAWAITQGHAGGKDSLFAYFHRDLVAFEQRPDEVLKYGQRLTSVARFFRWIRQPQDSPLDKGGMGSLRDLRDWSTQPAEGLVLWLLRCYSDGRLAEEDLRASFEIVLSFMARRQLGGYEPNLHKSIFVATARKLRSRTDLSGGEVVEYLKFILSSGEEVRSWPADESIKAIAQETPVYAKARSGWTFLILERINRVLFDLEKHAPPHLERSAYSVEHVLPQTLTPEWNADLQAWGVADPVRLHQSRLHVIGNLTLTPINSELGNMPFEKKRTKFHDDWLRLNASVVAAEEWSEAKINERSRVLAAKACQAFVAPMSFSEIQLARAKFGEQTPQSESDVAEVLAELAEGVE